MSELWLTGRVAVVTGASRGIGAATAAAVAAAGAHVVLAARDRPALDGVAGGYQGRGRPGHAGAGDVRATRPRSGDCSPRSPGSAS